ncbi:hypothetical protein SISSUDRAFT_348426 [Sistotremastrum suecicum HHB10207 ss-3]|uniref:RecQ mediated genome instability protein 1 OB-fold domain-containing protein n=1 Tax=Sistotremastrum suecicum HHB10207 ss-3 TaxID=1314776 RepID=A0A166G1V1_9AGAM|nr:hypothetical protein SISSUDRAFT_348426 [Sistotremastrum suecicum HHB10207 ss-3]
METHLCSQICLKNVFFRRGIAFLEPSNTQMEGSRVEELEENQDKDFVAGLNMRLGCALRCYAFDPYRLLSWFSLSSRPIDEEEQTQQTLVASPPRVPLGDIDVPMATADATAPTAYEHDDDSQRRRKVPASSTLAQPSTLGASPYFTNTSSTLNNPPVASTSNAIDVDIDDFELHSDDIDEQFLAELDSVEQAYSQAPPMSQPTTTLRQVISIDDDDEEDKENVVSPQRRVRRRVEDRVIDISD